MQARDLVVGWGMLVTLSAATVLVTATNASGESSVLISAAALLLAGLKARIILTRYLGLQQSRFWMHAFDSVIGMFLVLAFSIYAFAAKG